MKRLPALSILLLSASFMAQSLLASLRDRNRVLLVFSPDSAYASYDQQQILLKNRASEMTDRDLIFIPVLANWRTSDSNLRKNSAAYTSDTEQIALRVRYRIKPADFTVILLGKDGDEKLRSHTPVTMEVLTKIIDSMPMRQQEVRDRHPN